MTIEDFVVLALQIKNQVQVYHWQVDRYGAHVALDEFNSKFGALVDSFVEVYIGERGKRPQFGMDTTEFHDFTDIDGIRNEFIPMLRSLFTESIEDLIGDSDSLENVRDDILNEIDTLSYLLTLK